MTNPAEPSRTNPTAVTLKPPAVVALDGELLPSDPTVWRPTSFEEWRAKQRTETFLSAWAVQMGHERDLRTSAARWVFGLIAVQVLGTFSLLYLQGRGELTIDAGVLKVVVPAVFGEVFGLGFVVTKYLFSQALRHGLDGLAEGAANGD